MSTFNVLLLGLFLQQIKGGNHLRHARAKQMLKQKVLFLTSHTLSFRCYGNFVTGSVLQRNRFEG